jgi:hypothetical protein
MMRCFEIEPDVAGGIGRGTVMDTSVHPPVVTKLVYQFEGWFGDSIVTTFPCFLVTEDVKRRLVDLGASGAAFAQAEITISENFHELQPDVELPPFVWLKIDGQAGRDDFGIAGNLSSCQSAL